jgi:type IV pilus assembly protein PilA
MRAHWKNGYKLGKIHSQTGFTLIELLVVIVIVGVLSSIALPSYLNQAGRARGSEAKASLGTINNAQRAYRLEQSQMAASLTDLSAQVSGKFYTYAITSAATNTASTSATPALATITDIKIYSSAVRQVPANPEFFGEIICESRRNGGTLPVATAPLTVGDRGSCGSDVFID